MPKTKPKKPDLAVLVGVAEDLDLAIDEFDNLVLVMGRNWNTSEERMVIGPVSKRLLDSLAEGAKRLRIHAP